MALLLCRFMIAENDLSEAATSDMVDCLHTVLMVGMQALIVSCHDEVSSFSNKHAN